MDMHNIVVSNIRPFCWPSSCSLKVQTILYPRSSGVMLTMRLKMRERRR